MAERTILLILSGVVLISLAACQPAALSSATETNPPTDTAQPSPSPTQTATPEPSPTSTPEPPADSPACFTPREILPFALMPDNAQLLIRTGSGVQIINLENLEEESFLEAPQNVYAAAISPDGGTLAWSLEDDSIQLIRLSDRETIATLTGHPDLVYDLRFSPAGDRLYSASHDGVVREWDLDGNLLSSIDAGGEVLGMGVSPDGTQLVTIPFDGPVALWDLASSERLAEFGSTVGYDTSDAVFSPDGQFLAADLATGIYLWRVSDAELLWNGVKNSMAVAFSPDGQFLAYSDIDDGNPVVLASPDGAQTVKQLGELQSPVWQLFFSSDGSQLVATDGVEIRIWQVEDGELIYIGKAACP